MGRPKTPVDKSFINWAGGKRALLPEILPRLPQHFNAYHEPFVGGGALFFAMNTERAFLSDANLRLVRTYRALQQQTAALIARLDEHATQHSPDYFAAMRRRDIDAESSDVEVGAWLLYLNRTAFNGLYRVNAANVFNVPLGTTRSRDSICNPPQLWACAERLQRAHIEHADFVTTANRPAPGDLVYCDPPYVPLSATSSFTSYTATAFGYAQQVALRDLALDWLARGVHVVLSNAWHPLVCELYDGPHFELIPLMARRAVAARAPSRAPVTEALILGRSAR